MQKNFCKRLLLLFGLLILVLFAFLFLLGFRGGVVQSSSMSPTVMPGSIMVYRLGQSVEIGDMVAYSLDECVIVHRISKKLNDSLVVKGDSAQSVEDVVALDNVLGKVVFVSASLGDFVTWAKIIVFVLVVLIICGLTKSIIVKKNTKQK